MIAVWLAMMSLVSAPLDLKNSALRSGADGALEGWERIGQCRVIPDGGRGGAPAVELESTGEGMNAALQVLQFDPPRRGAFEVSAWIRCDEVGEGGDCSVWLDVLQSGGPPMWGQQGVPDRGLEGWQKVRAIIRPTHPVTQVSAYLILRGVKGRVRFCDVRAADLPLRIESLQVYPSGASSYEVRAVLSDGADWRVSARQGRSEVWSHSGEGVRFAGRFDAPHASPVTVTLSAELNGQTRRESARSAPRAKLPAFDWWVVDPLSRVFQDDLPPARPAQKADLHAARGDRESFQVCIRPTGKELGKVRVTVSDLVCGGGQCAAQQSHYQCAAQQSHYRISRSEVEWFRVGYVPVEQPAAHPFSSRRTSSWWPDPLLPAREFAVEASEVQPLWFTIHVPAGTPPGLYKGSIAIQADGAPPASVPVALTVHPATIPIQGYMKTAFALMDGHLEKLYGRITPELRRAYTDYLLAHRLNPDDISRTTLPDLDELQYANSRGLNAFNILNVVSEPEKNVLWTCFSPLEDYTPEFRERFFRRLDAFVPELEKRGLIDKAYIYGFDERGPEYIPVIRDLFGEIKRRYPRVRTLSTCWPPAGTDPLSMNIDWFVPLTSSYDHKLAREVRRRGGEVWWYVCMGPNYPYANWLLENPLMESRLIWWQAFAHDVEGFLYWGLNIWERRNNDKPISASAGPRIDWSQSSGGNYQWLNGDGVLLYPGERGPIGSIRLENIRDGLEDTELLRQHKERFGVAATEKIVHRVTTSGTSALRSSRIASALRSSRIASALRSSRMTSFSREPRDLLAARLELLKAIR